MLWVLTLNSFRSSFITNCQMFYSNKVLVKFSEQGRTRVNSKVAGLERTEKRIDRERQRERESEIRRVPLLENSRRREWKVNLNLASTWVPNQALCLDFVNQRSWNCLTETCFYMVIYKTTWWNISFVFLFSQSLLTSFVIAWYWMYNCIPHDLKLYIPCLYQ